MLKDKIKKIVYKIGFTKTEVNVILFLSSIFIISLLVKIFDISTDKKNKIFNYSKTDSLFNAENSLNLEEKLEKKVDNEEELLDFRNKKISKKENLKSNLREKSININEASLETLKTLPSIGIKTAELIILYRKKNGKFKNIKSLLKIKGIGKAKLKKIEKYIIVK